MPVITSERSDNASLVFFQLMFGGAFNRAAVRNILQDVFRRSNVRSYTISEIYGIYDHVLRVWLPLGLSAPRLAAEISSELRESSCIRVLPFFVEKCVYHWAWSQLPEYQLRVPLQAEIDELNELL